MGYIRITPRITEKCRDLFKNLKLISSPFLPQCHLRKLPEASDFFHLSSAKRLFQSDIM